MTDHKVVGRGSGRPPVSSCSGARRSTPGSATMANSAPGGANDYNAKIVEEFRANQGRVGGPWAGTPLILIHHVGAKSGVERVLPVGCFPRYHNLKANPRINVEVGAQTFAVLAEELEGAARAELWPKLVAEVPQLGGYQARITRQIPVFMLTRQD